MSLQAAEGDGARQFTFSKFRIAGRAFGDISALRAILGEIDPLEARPEDTEKFLVTEFPVWSWAGSGRGTAAAAVKVLLAAVGGAGPFGLG